MNPPCPPWSILPLRFLPSILTFPIRNPEIPLPGLAKFLSAPVSDYGFDFLSCTDCNGLRFFTRIQYSPYCSGTSGSNELCGYACPNQTLVKTAELAVTTLKHEFESKSPPSVFHASVASRPALFSTQRFDFLVFCTNDGFRIWFPCWYCPSFIQHYKSPNHRNQKKICLFNCRYSL